MVYPNPQIYHPLRTIFVHVPKTAGTSIERALLQGSRSIVGGHTTALGYRSKYPDCFASYFKFTVIRDPVDRFISAYLYLRQEPIHPAHNNQIIHDCPTLADFLPWLQDHPEAIQNRVHLIPQHRFICDHQGHILVDALYPYHDLRRAWEEICHRSGLPHQPLPRFNISRRPSEDLGSTPGLIPLIETLYAADYHLLNLPRRASPEPDKYSRA